MNKVVLVGRMNVGKSTLFNRLSENVKSITLDYEGVTRDFIKDRVNWQDYSFELIDSGGIIIRKTNDPILQKVKDTVIELVKSADVVVFVLDAIVGLLPEDREISKLLHKLGKTVVLAVNKVDNNQALENIYEFEQLGHKELVLISASHGRNINELLDAIVKHLPYKEFQEPKKDYFEVTFLGRPNAGKSSLLNALLNQERALVSSIPGTTREPISESVQFYKQSIQLTDMPGIRRRRSIGGELEPLMVKKAFSALKKTDIVILLIDGSESSLVEHELKLASYAFNDQYKALIILINKTDIMTEQDQEALERNFDYYKHLIKKVPVLFISVKSGKNVGRVLPLLEKVWKSYNYKFTKAELNRLFITELQKKPLYHKRERLKIYEVQQIATAPITISMTVNIPDWFESSQLSFFENVLRKNYSLNGVPIKFILKKG